MKRVEITFSKYQRELEKLNNQLDRAKKSYEKKYANAVKCGVAGWTREEYNEWLANVETVNFFIVNKEDVKLNKAYTDMMYAEMELQDIEERVANAEKRLEKADEKVQQYYAELEKIDDLKAKEGLAKKTFEEEQKEWAKDGITLESRYYGTTPKGNKFLIYGNSGFTNRAMHCFTLYINGSEIFTSGEFWRAYSVIKNS